MSRALGRYELLRPLARGGMAEVFLARRRAAGVEKWLVVKRIRAERAGDARFLDLFVREARLSMSLAHQNIVPVFDFGRIDEQVFIAMERVEGKDLGSSLARAGDHPIPSLVAAFVAAECLQALDYAHKRRSEAGAPLGIVHRDVTPRNVLLSWSGEVKLTDFGIAALAGEQASASKTIGTPAYMAPEQARGEQLDARADLYAVGLVLREMLSGKRGRPGDDREAVLAMARTGELVEWHREVPATLCAIVDRACAVQREDRFASATEMLAAVDAFIVGERAEKRGDAPARLVAKWLEDVWGSAAQGADREHGGNSGGASGGASDDIEGGHLVSFMDDGELGVMGTGTVRSLAMTAADEAKPAQNVDLGPRASDVGQRSEPVPVSVSDAKRGWRALALATVVAAMIGGGWLATRGDGHPAAQAQPAPAPEPVAVTRAVTPSLTSTSTPTSTPTLPPTPTPTPSVTPTPTVAVVRPTRSLVHTPAMPVVHATMPPTVTAQRFKGTVNIKGSWAYFTIDGDPAQHATPDNDVELPAGDHHVHFWNPETKVERDVTITVPDRSWTWAEKLAP